jgi:hypothetical protein
MPPLSTNPRVLAPGCLVIRNLRSLIWQHAATAFYSINARTAGRMRRWFLSSRRQEGGHYPDRKGGRKTTGEGKSIGVCPTLTATVTLQLLQLYHRITFCSTWVYFLYISKGSINYVYGQPGFISCMSKGSIYKLKQNIKVIVFMRTPQSCRIFSSRLKAATQGKKKRN